MKDYPGGDRISSLKDLEVEGKRVFVRVDFNVPLSDKGVGAERVKDATRIEAALPTIRNLLERGAKVICASHLGRPKGGPDAKYSLEPVAEKLGALLGTDVIFAHDCIGDGIHRQSRDLKPGQVFVLENLRFHPEEEKNGHDFAFKLSQLADVYVNDAFGTSHRAHSSVDGLPKLMKHKAAGLLLEREVESLAGLIHNPPRPLISILGGSKVSDKAKVIESLMVKSEKIFIGGAMAYTFLRALNCDTGDSRVEVDMVGLAKRILDRAKEAKCKILLPVDHVTGKTFDEPGEAKVTDNAHIPAGRIGLDIGPKTRELYVRELKGAAAVFWNGPMGVFEKKPFDEGTNAIAQAIADLPARTKICGGGDSVAAINQAGLEAGFTHISTGGGASLEMLEGAPMPGIEALKATVGA
jgi:phosphoglycerate kinase